MKRFISMILSIAMLTSVPAAASAALSDKTTITQRRDCNIDIFFNTFPVITEEITSDGRVTRGEFAYVIKSILDRSGAAAYGEDYGFSDVNDETDYADEIRTVAWLGYMNDADTSGRFRPEDTITDTEAARCMAKLLNVDYMIDAAKSEAIGVWEALDRAKVDIDPAGSEENASWIKLLVYRSLNGCVGVTSGTDKGYPQMSVDTSTTYIEKFWEMHKTEGQLSANSMIEINGKTPAGDNSVVIGENTYTSYLVYENSAYIGQYVTAFVSDKGIDENRVVCMFPNEKYDPAVIVNARDVDTVNDLSRLKVYDKNGKSRIYNVSPLANIYYNFDYMGPVRAVDYSNAKVKEMLGAISAGGSCEIVLISSQQSNTYDFVWVRAFENYAVSRFSYEDYKIQDKFGVKLELENAFMSNNMVLFNDENALADAVGIQENDIISLMLSYDSEGRIDRALGYLSRTTVSGIMSTVGNNDECLINGTKYYVSSRYKALAAANDKNVLSLEPGLRTTFYLNVFNEIAAVSLTDHYTEGESYAFLISAVYDDGEDKVYLRLLNEDGTVTRENPSDKLIINGTKYTGAAAIEYMSKFSGERLVGNVCDVYRLARVARTDGEIKEIALAYAEERPSGTPLEDLYPDKILKTNDGSVKADVIYKNNTFGKRVGITTSTVMFDVPIKEKNAARVAENDAYTATSVSNMIDDCVLGIGGVKNVGADAKGAYMEFFDTDSTLFASAAVRYYSYDEAAGGVASPPEMLADCLIVSKVVDRAIDENGEEIKLIEGYRAGAKVTLATKPIRDFNNPWGQFSTLTDASKGAWLQTREGYKNGEYIKPEDIAKTGVLPGDVLQLTMDSQNRISNILINVRGGDKENAAWLCENGNDSNTSILSAGAGHGNEYLGVNYGTVVEIQNGKVVLDEIDGKERVYSIGSPTITVYNRNARGENTRKGGTADIEIGKDIYIRQYYSAIKEIVVFED